MRKQYGGFIEDDDGAWVDFSEWLIDANWEKWVDYYLDLEELWDDVVRDDYPISFEEAWRSGRRFRSGQFGEPDWVELEPRKDLRGRYRI